MRLKKAWRKLHKQFSGRLERGKYYWFLLKGCRTVNKKIPQVAYVSPFEISRDVYGPLKKIMSPRLLEDCSNKLGGVLVVGGEWDLQAADFSQTGRSKYELLHESIRLKYVHGVPWEKTSLYEHLESMKEKGSLRDKRYLDIGKRLKQLDELYLSMKVNGYLFDNSEALCVAVSRTGELMRARNGNHRLAMAKALGLSSIPVKIIVVHKFFVQTGKPVFQ